MMFDPLLLIIYVCVSAVVGFLGRNRAIGFPAYLLSHCLFPLS